jgi:hypothetical protein
MSEGKENDVQDQKPAEELAPEDLEKAVGGAFDTYLNFNNPKGENKP